MLLRDWRITVKRKVIQAREGYKKLRHARDDHRVLFFARQTEKQEE